MSEAVESTSDCEREGSFKPLYLSMSTMPLMSVSKLTRRDDEVESTEGERWGLLGSLRMRVMVPEGMKG